MLYTQIIINGLTIAAYLALMALGLTLLFGVLRIVNFVHGVMLMLGGYAAFLCTSQLGKTGYYVALVAAPAAVAVFAVLLNLAFFRRFTGNLLSGAVMSIALSVVFQNLAWMWFGGDPKRVLTPFEGVYRFGGLIISKHRLVVVLATIAVVFAVHWFIRHTRTGRALRAVEQNPYAAQLVGIDTSVLSYATFALSGALAGLAGALIAPTQLILPNMGATPLLMAFVVIILGGMGSITGALVAAVVVGLAQSLITTLWSPQLAVGASFLIAMAILAVRPTGLFGR